ncbi:MAG: glycerol-3-phosphate dehydrogenase [Hyphomicrobiales bacterium]|nr:glycerol-3-phosphate dehydrogenase [Hyphomicrobiales bacterium]MDE2114650.1 glycerol-3-phosphate dehydrogenase [Hyphomicrobiales bacterium]
MNTTPSLSGSEPRSVDVFVIGGGVNGCGIARDAIGRGYSVALAEMNDLASGTSSKATKLIHGGLRYLEHYAFRLVREALGEREIVWRNAPHLVHPLRFVLPHHAGLRPAWMLRLGLFIYDHLGGPSQLPGTRKLDLRHDAAGAPLKPEFKIGFEYSDCWVDDARMVVALAQDAQARGAHIRTRCKVIDARAVNGAWVIRTRDQHDGRDSEWQAKILINAAGPWVDHILGDVLARREPEQVRLVKGSHIIVKKIFEHDRCYIFQNGDARIIFAIPYEDDFTLIGTTDIDFTGDVSTVEISADETQYLCAAASEYFVRPIAVSDVVSAYSGVRPLYNDHAAAAQEATRDYVIREEKIDQAPLVNIFGGKITTYRRLSESILTHIEAGLGARGASWTKNAPLPGGDFENGDMDALIAAILKKKPFLPAALANRLAKAYGSRTLDMLGQAQGMADLGEDFGAGLTATEIDYLVAHEWAQTAEDILWRRSKLGLHLPAQAAEAINAYLAQKSVARAAVPTDLAT